MSCRPAAKRLAVDGPSSGGAWKPLLAEAVPATSSSALRPGSCLDPHALERLVETAEAAGAGMVYADYAEVTGKGIREHPVNDYQTGSLRDGFDFGPLILLSTAAARKAIRKYGEIPAYRWAGWYDLRLKISTDRVSSISRSAFRWSRPPAAASGKGGRVTSPTSIRGTGRLQEEMEAAATAHLKRIGAWLAPEFRDVPPSLILSRGGERRHPRPEPGPDRGRRGEKRPCAADRFPLQRDRRGQPFHRRHDGDSRGPRRPPSRPEALSFPNGAISPSAAAGTRRSFPSSAAGTPFSSIRTTSTAETTSSSGSSISCAGETARWPSAPTPSSMSG